MNRYDNAVRRQVYSISGMIAEMLPAVQENARSVAEQLNRPAKLILSGCGDCYSAVLAVREAISGWLGVPVEVKPPLELSRHTSANALTGSLVLLMSKSGGAARVREAAARMKKLGVQTIALTAKSESTLAQSADVLFHLPIPAFESAPGVRSHVAMMLGAHLLAAALGERFNGRMTLETCAAGIAQAAGYLPEFLPKWDETAFELAQDYKNARAAEMIGGGSDLGSAWYAHAKIYETVGLPACFTDCEDWFHLHYFAAKRSETLTMIFDHRQNPSASRTRELLEKLGRMGMDAAVVTDDAGMTAKYRFLFPQAQGWQTPYLQYAAGPLTAAYLAKLNGQPFNCGFAGPWAHNLDAPSTTNSKQILI